MGQLVDLITKGVGLVNDDNAGAAAEANAKVQAHYNNVDADNAQIAAQQTAENDRKQARYLRSRALAVAGASGAGAHDSQVTDIMADIDKEGEVNALRALASGDVEARALRAGARAKLSEGAAMRSVYQSQGITAFAKSAYDFYKSEEGQTFFDKYGGDKASAQTIGMGTGYSDFAGTGSTSFDA